MVQLLSQITLSEAVDEVSWALEKSGKYTTRSLYKELTTGGIIDTRMLLIWKSNIPLKVKSSFGWQLMIEYNLEFN